MTTEEFKKDFVEKSLDVMKDACLQIKRLIDNGASWDDIKDVYDIPPAMVHALTGIEIPTKTFIVPIQVLTEGYVAVEAFDETDAIFTARRAIKDLKATPSKLTTNLSNKAEMEAMPIPDTQIIEVLSKAYANNTFKGKLLETPKSMTSFCNSLTEDKIREDMLSTFDDCDDNLLAQLLDELDKNDNCECNDCKCSECGDE